MRQLAQRTFRTGVQTLIWNPLSRRFFMHLKNRRSSYYVEIPEAAARRYYRRLRP